MLPEAKLVCVDDTHRLIPSRYSDSGEGVLGELASSKRELDDLMELEGATNDRLLGESGLLPGISVHELVFGVSYAHIVNAAFTHARPGGSRFSGPDRGVWYASFEFETACKEVEYHKRQELLEIDWKEEEVASYVEYLADFRAEFHDLRDDERFADCLSPVSYARPQALGRELLEAGSAGVVYPSVRHQDGTCVGCFRPALVVNVREGVSVEMKFADARSEVEIEVKKQGSEEGSETQRHRGR